MDIALQALQEALARDCQGVIDRAEQAWRDTVDAVSARLSAMPGRRILLLAGPSASGKTTTARLLQEALAAAGQETATVSLDDFYRSAEEADYPRHADGSPNFEAPQALDIPALHTALAAALSGRAHPMPRFDFLTHRRIEGAPLCLPPHGCLILEGLHALHPAIAAGLPQGQVLSVFVSVSTNLTGADGSILLSGRKLRFLRRLVRDSIYRASDAARTYALWHKVLAGEDEYLYPYRGRADICLNSFHDYEVGVLSPFALPLLSADGAPCTPYTQAVYRAAERFTPLSPACVPQGSLLREFLPESTGQ